MLQEIYKGNKLRIAFTYCVLIVEFVILSLLPYLLGKTLDSLLAHQYTIFWIYLGLNGFALCIGVIRRTADGRIFETIWGKSVAVTVERLVQKGVDPTRIVSRCQMVRVFADFFQYHVPQIVNALIEISIAIFMIILVVPLAGGVAACLFGGSLGIMYYVSLKIQQLETNLQFSREQADKLILNKNTGGVAAEYEKRVKYYIKENDWSCTGWGLVDILTLIASVAVLFALVNNKKSLGEIMATLNYTVVLFRRMDTIAAFLMQWRQMQIADKFINKISA